MKTKLACIHFYTPILKLMNGETDTDYPIIIKFIYVNSTVI